VALQDRVALVKTNDHEFKLELGSGIDSSLINQDDKGSRLSIAGNSNNSDPNAEAWLAYGLARMDWLTPSTQAKFPEIPKNRRGACKRKFMLWS
jgi:hypothetical protein